MAKVGIVLSSASYEPGPNPDATRDSNVAKAIEGAGYELPEAPLPAQEDTSTLAPQQAFETLVVDYGRQVSETTKKYGDWQKVVGQDIHIGIQTQHAMLLAENGAEVAYYLGRHPVYARRLGTMTPREQEEEVKRLSAMLPKPDRADSRPRRPSRNTVENATFAEIAAMPPYPGKGRDLKRCRGR